MKPGVGWYKTPEDKKQWHRDNNCDAVMGGSELKHCPYTCGNECDFIYVD